MSFNEIMGPLQSHGILYSEGPEEGRVWGMWGKGPITHGMATRGHDSRESSGAFHLQINQKAINREKQRLSNCPGHW